MAFLNFGVGSVVAAQVRVRSRPVRFSSRACRGCKSAWCSPCLHDKTKPPLLLAPRSCACALHGALCPSPPRAPYGPSRGCARTTALQVHPALTRRRRLPHRPRATRCRRRRPRPGRHSTMPRSPTRRCERNGAHSPKPPSHAPHRTAPGTTLLCQRQPCWQLAC